MDKNSLYVPIAIVIAGVLIAGAVFLSNKNQAAQKAASAGTTANPDIVLQPVTASDHIQGSPDASIVAVEFSDLECPFCKQFQATMHKLLQKYGATNDLAWVYRQYPIPELHPKAPKEAEASECAAEQGGNDAFWKFIDSIYSITPSNNGLDPAQLPATAKSIGLDVAKFNTCLSSGKFASKVADSVAQAKAAGGNGTPYTVLVLKTPLSADNQQFVSDTNTAILQQVRSSHDVLFASKDGKMIAMSGAFPYELIDSILGQLLKK